MRWFGIFLAALWCGAHCCPAAETNKFTSEERLAPEHLAAVHEDVQRIARTRHALPDFSIYRDFRAVMHVHAEDSDHTKGTRDQVLAAAKKTGVKIVFLSDHRGPKLETWRGLRDGVLFFAGSEDGDGVLRFPGFDANSQPQTNGQLRFICHVEERYDADTAGYAGMEICNRHTDAKLDKGAEKYLLAAAANEDSWNKVAESFRKYPDEMFAAGTDYHAEIFAKWDKTTRNGPFTGIAANDAHQNQIFKGITFDPYEVSFRNLTTHILARELTDADVRQALRDGHAYVAHDWLCDPTGFVFGAQNGLGAFPMGDPAVMWGKTRLMALTPAPAKLKLFLNGNVISQSNGTNLVFEAKKPGAYRLEAWLTVGGEDRPWIYSNPVYLEESSWASIPWPAIELGAAVVEKKDLTYKEGQPEDESKHKLDIYAPKGEKLSPILIFFHGGAWRNGDRSLYSALGYRFAGQGILTIVPSYRLAPKNKHPAQVEDAAAAFAWVMRHGAEFGGDTNRVYVGGHSAGGHISALLALDDKYLKAEGFSPKNIHGVIPMSGVFDLTSIGNSQASVFGKDDIFRKAASPLFHVTKVAPPFLITCCQWDYPTLSAQARDFWEALKSAGVTAKLYFTPRENHISEVVALTREKDATA
ncbi:MAG TPA: alpha/beta hydrolase fold domain-containing protein, partial [Verrucomicrobiae bacterium]